MARLGDPGAALRRRGAPARLAFIGGGPTLVALVKHLAAFGYGLDEAAPRCDVLTTVPLEALGGVASMADVVDARMTHVSLKALRERISSFVASPRGARLRRGPVIAFAAPPCEVACASGVVYVAPAHGGASRLSRPSAPHPDELRRALGRTRMVEPQRGGTGGESPRRRSHRSRARVSGLGARFDDVLVERMAAMAHARWFAAKRIGGWRYAAIRGDAVRLHPSVIPYAELSGSEKEKDRVLMRAIPDMLASIGESARPAP